MTNWKLIALDIDGTTLPRSGTLSEENRKWILEAKRQGIQVTFATGRHRKGIVSDYVRELEVEAPFVTLNGGEVWTPDGQLLARHLLTAEQITYLHQLALRHNVYYWGGTVEFGVTRADFPKDVSRFSWIKFGYLTEDLTVLRKIWTDLENKGEFSLSNSDPHNIEVNAAGVSKASGLQTVVDTLGLQPSQVVAIGDSLNDVPMLRWAGMAVAMENAQDEVKKVAQKVTSSSENNGVARAIQEILDMQ